MFPLKADDPKFQAGSPTNFMVLTRATQGANGEANNQTSPFVDQSQTYTSHPSHQVFLRDYELRDGRPVGTGKMITGTGDGMASWADVKAAAATKLGIRLVDTDVDNVPLLVTDPYGRFERGPNGFPLMVVPNGADGVPDNADDGTVEGNPNAPVTTAGAATKTGHAFIDDIAHHAVPRGDANPADGPGPITDLAEDSDGGTTDDNDPATYDDEMLDSHFIAGDRAHPPRRRHREHHRDRPGSDPGTARRLARRSHRPARVGLRGAPLPGCPLRHRDGVPAPRLRGVRPQGPADGQPVR
jgi:hypothetical protein